ncbi:hypothetical protein SADUNF_Sadunf12G0049300 [Salix dunnii]|uniref:Uncharacterized protein n=1 Tax=Salix dunnii TaxID=1413687 RepID=A0A835MVV3_9ROSI|nr:hypothetical protein SADUNF_Sadunf12G0049300 [Salix dunnii]
MATTPSDRDENVGSCAKIETELYLICDEDLKVARLEAASTRDVNIDANVFQDPNSPAATCMKFSEFRAAAIQGM